MLTGSTDLAQLSSLIAALQAMAQNANAIDFRHAALQALRGPVPFDHAIWGEATIGDRFRLRAPALLDLDPLLLGEVEKGAFSDPRLAHILAAPGITMAYSVEPTDPPELRASVERLGVKHIMSTAFHDPTIGLASGIVLLRSARSPAFTERERGFVEAAFPHLLSGCTTYRVRDLLHEVGLTRQSNFSAASVEGNMIVAAESAFGELIRMEWPDWAGPLAPPELANMLASPNPTTYLGLAIALRCIPSRRSIATLLIARERHAADALTRRQVEVARKCAFGADYRTIARDLSISPNTVRNHIAEIHRRLGVRKSAALGPILERLGFLD